MDKPLPRLWTGSNEAIFDVLPQTVLANFHNRRSENALLWNLIYPRAYPSLDLQALLALDYLWGSAMEAEVLQESLTPYFWGISVSGKRLPGLDEVLDRIDGPGPRTEVDLFFLGQTHLILVEAKHTSSFGRCMRYVSGRCPEMHRVGDTVCQYWEAGAGYFADLLSLGPRPAEGDLNPPCNLHYQLARTYVIGKALAERLERTLLLWSFVPKKKWRSLERTWLDFANRVQDEQDWRAMRVIAWEQLRKLPVR
jgi:hypothetical protein